MADTAWPEVIGGLLGGGTIGTIVTRWLRSRTAEKRIEARLIELENAREDRVRDAALRLVDHASEEAREAREETGKHFLNATDMARELGRLGAENVELRARVGALEEEVRQLRDQVERLLPEALKGYALTDTKSTPPAQIRVLRDREKA
jgi:HAMP domain-containing protein